MQDTKDMTLKEGIRIYFPKEELGRMVNQEGSRRQERFCAEKHLPMFAPKNGVCDFCHRPIYFGDDKHPAYSLEYAASHLITGCRNCGHSFVD